MGLTTALWAIGTAAAVGGQLYAGYQAAQAQEYNARVAEQQAKVERQRGKIEADRQRRDAQRLIARQRAGYGASGVAILGSPLEVLSDTAEEAEYDALLTEWGANTQAGFYETEAKQRRKSARGQTFGAFLGAGSTFLSSSYNLASGF